jgi:gliding motility associated protien GldN
MKVYKFLLPLVIAGPSVLMAQVDVEALPTKNSTLKIPVYEQLYKVRVWRDMDLKEKQNKGFFARGNEISRLIVEGIKSGEIAKVYENDSLNDKTAKTKAQFFQAFEMRPAVTYDAWDALKSYATTERVKYKGLDYEATADNSGIAPDDANAKDYWVKTSAGQAQTFEPGDIYKLQIVEDIIFDKRRSRLYYDVIAIQMMAWDINGSAFKPLGWIKYSDLEKLWRAHPEKAVWFNRQNTAQNRNFADAFLLRLFHASIYKVENPDDFDLSSIYTNYNESVFAREWEEMKLMEKEHNLWEY